MSVTSAHPSPSTRRVLVIDDDAATLVAIPELIAIHRPTFHVDTATNLAESSTYLDDYQCDAIVADVRMPGEDGIKLIRRLRDKGHRIPVVIVTADVTDVVEDAAFGAGAYAFLRKPLDVKQFLRVLDSAAHYPHGDF
ncbi:response regulator [Candidatus Nitrospira bockiana]